jgi:hypothetical protein
LLTGGGEAMADRCARANTWLSATGDQFLADPEVFQTEAFGNASLVVIADDVDQLVAVIESLEGQFDRLHLLGRRRRRRDYAPIAFALPRRSVGCSMTRCRPAWRSARR